VLSQTIILTLTWEKTAALSSTTHTYHSAAAAQISTLRQVTESLVKAGTREDKPTGDTPHKKTWQYQDEWELTKSRDVVLKEWRKRGISARDSDTFLAEHLPLPDGDEEEVATDDGDAIMKEAHDAEEEEEVEDEVLAQSVASSLSSSSTAASVTIRQKYALPPPIPAPVLKPAHKRTSSIPSKSGLPTMGTLTERPTNIFGGRRRIR
jgi:kinesin family protein 11